MVAGHFLFLIIGFLLGEKYYKKVTFKVLGRNGLKRISRTVVISKRLSGIIWNPLAAVER